MSLSSATRTVHPRSDHSRSGERTSWLTSWRAALGQFRRKYLPTDAELDLDYLNGSGDLRELEYRMRRLDEMRSRSRRNTYRRL
jgi:hypothetical protein